MDWATEHIVPKICALYQHSNYLYRMTALFCVQAMADTVNIETLKDSFIPLVIQMAEDPVPNIRFNVAKTLKCIVRLR